MKTTELNVNQKINFKQSLLRVRDIAISECINGGTLKQLSATLDKVSDTSIQFLGYAIKL